MIDLKGFRKANSLSQNDVAEYLGVSRSFIGQVEAGFSKLPESKINKLIANNNGWDVTCLSIGDVNGDHIHQNGGKNNIGKVIYDNSETATLKRENELLRQQVAELREQNERYWNMIEKLTEK